LAGDRGAPIHRGANRRTSLAGTWTSGAYIVIAACLVFTVLSIVGSYRALTPATFEPAQPTALEDDRARPKKGDEKRGQIYF
tara:strand:- start:421 stop:666 length:246 start_codon:yes stop_codon:yes gene_type:complete